MNAVTGGLAACSTCLPAGCWPYSWRRRRHGGRFIEGRSTGPGLGAVILHAMILAQTVFQPAGLNLGFFNALSFTGWLINVVLLAAAMVRPVESLGIIALPFGALTLVLGLSFATERIVADPGQWPLELHILIAILAYSLLTLAAAQATLLAIQDPALAAVPARRLLRGIPPLTAMESCCSK